MRYYITFAGISGTTTNRKYIGASRLLTYENDEAGSIRFSKTFDKATQALMGATFSDDTISWARAVCEEDGKVVFKTTFSNLKVNSFQESGRDKNRIEYYSVDYGGSTTEWPQ